jgi:hypothetical protein
MFMGAGLSIAYFANRRASFFSTRSLNTQA